MIGKEEALLRKREQARLRHRRWMLAHPERHKAAIQKWYSTNAERLNKEARERRARDPDKHREYKRKWYLENQEHDLKRQREWIAKHKEHCRTRLRNYMRRRYQTNLYYRLRTILGVRMHQALKRARTSKAHHTFDLVGTTPDLLKQHIESQFTLGMTWDNLGEWQIDHKRPCASFDLTQESQQRECFHYSNLQPLWKLDNLRKSAKVLP